MQRLVMVTVVIGLGACSGDTASFLVPGPEEVELAVTANTVAQSCGAVVDDGADGSPDSFWTFEYSDGGRRERDVNTDLHGNVIEDLTIEYDNAGRWIGFLDAYTFDGVTTVFNYRILYDTF